MTGINYHGFFRGFMGSYMFYPAIEAAMPLRRSCVNCETKGPHCFCSLDRVALQRLDGLGAWVRLNPREHVLREGLAPDHVYVICHGTIKLTTSSSDGRLLLLRIAGPGDVLGLAAALKRSRYEATAVALETCQVKAIPRSQFMLFMEEFQAVGRNSSMALAREYESAVLSARRLALSGNATAKLASVLAEWGGLILAGEHDEDVPRTGAGVSFRMPLTHEELGHMAGISRETVTRVLSIFRRDDLVRVDGEFMTLPDLSLMEDRAGY
jgi:CRP/FNR family cyclic AMP-dependent transcriptional regulator